MTALTPPQVTFRRELAAAAPLLRRRALALTGKTDRAEDLVQDTLERALRFEHTYEPGSNLLGWLYRVMHNVFMSGCRRHGVALRALRLLTLAGQEQRHTPPEPWLSPPVERALHELPDKIGKVVRLVDLEDMSYGDAASLLDVPLGTVMSRLHRGRRRLAARLRDGEIRRSSVARAA